jgi:heme/copper-type cytochrome/quinol oxidase subunit 2
VAQPEQSVANLRHFQVQPTTERHSAQPKEKDTQTDGTARNECCCSIAANTTGSQFGCKKNNTVASSDQPAKGHGVRDDFICILMVSIFFPCTFPISIAALVLAVRVRRALKRQNYPVARAAYRILRTLWVPMAFWAVLVCLGLIATIIALAVLGII